MDFDDLAEAEHVREEVMWDSKAMNPTIEHVDTDTTYINTTWYLPYLSEYMPAHNISWSFMPFSYPIK